MYGRLRGVPAAYLEAMVDSLLQRLGLGQYADRVCDSYSGGNKRKLSVAIALVGDPPAVLMDEPSTGMDPGAKRFLWDLIQKQVVDAGNQSLLTAACSADDLCRHCSQLQHAACLADTQSLPTATEVLMDFSAAVGPLLTVVLVNTALHTTHTPSSWPCTLVSEVQACQSQSCIT